MKAALRVICALLVALAVAAAAGASEHERCVQVPRERFDAFLSQMRPQPVFRNGGWAGYRIYEFPGGNKLPALGLQQGDLITRFCGLPVAEVFMLRISNATTVRPGSNVNSVAPASPCPSSVPMPINATSQLCRLSMCRSA